MLRTSLPHLGAFGLLGLLSTGSALGQGTDDCASPEPISGAGSFPYDTTIATPSGLDFGGAPCETTLNEDVFFVWTSTVAGDPTFSLCNATYDTQLQVSLGSDCSAMCVANDDNSCGAQSEIELLGVPAGATYLIQVGAFTPGTTGAGAVDVNYPALPPPNDTCATAAPISGPGFFVYDTTTATTTGFDGGDATVCTTGGGTDVQQDVFFAWTATQSGDTAFATTGGTANALVSVHVGGDCSATCLGLNDDGVGIEPEARNIVPGVVIGDVYLVQVGEWLSGFGGPGLLEIGLWSPPPPPANDDCATAAAIVGVGGFAYDRTWAGTSGFDGGNPGLCAQSQSAGPIGRDLFWRWTAAADGDFLIDNCGALSDSVLNVHVGGDCAATCLVSNDLGACAVTAESAVTLTGVSTGDVFLVQLGDWNDGPTSLATGLLNVSVALPPPANDDCSGPRVISGVGPNLWFNDTATTSGFNAGMLPCPSLPAVPQADVFFEWTALVDGDYVFDTIGTPADTILSVHLGSGCGATCLATDDDGGGGFVSRVVRAGIQAGDTLLLQVGTASLVGTTTVGTLNIALAPPPPRNDTCANPLVIVGEGSFPYVNFDTTDSGFDGGNGTLCAPASLGSAPNADLFFAWTAACDGDFRVSTCPSSFDTVVSVHVGADCSATCLAGANDGPCSGTLAAEVQFPASQGTSYLLQIGTWASGAIVTTDVTLERLGIPCPPSGIRLTCGPASPHYLGGVATLATSSLGAGTPSGLHLECTGGPAGEFGFFLVAPTATSAVSVFSGVLCLDNPQGRYNPNVATNQGLPQLNSLGAFDATGVLQNIVGTSASGSGFDVPLELPFAPAGQLVIPGSTWSFQCWFRDQVAPFPNPGSSANFSDVAEVTFP